jgi:hypothetical protein
MAPPWDAVSSPVPARLRKRRLMDKCSMLLQAEHDGIKLGIPFRRFFRWIQGAITWWMKGSSSAIYIACAAKTLLQGGPKAESYVRVMTTFGISIQEHRDL